MPRMPRPRARRTRPSRSDRSREGLHLLLRRSLRLRRAGSRIRLDGGLQEGRLHRPSRPIWPMFRRMSSARAVSRIQSTRLTTAIRSTTAARLTTAIRWTTATPRGRLRAVHLLELRRLHRRPFCRPSRTSRRRLRRAERLLSLSRSTRCRNSPCRNNLWHRCRQAWQATHRWLYPRCRH